MFFVRFSNELFRVSIDRKRDDEVDDEDLFIDHVFKEI